MTTRMVAFLAIVSLALPAFAQTTQPAETSPQIIGTVTGKNVYVRSGPGTETYPCTKLSSPATVTVVSKKNGWLQIQPPPGVFSVISKQFVTADADGKSGSVSGDNVWVRAGGEEQTSDFWYLQRRLNKGARVQILGDASDSKGEWYKIVPPDGVYWWINEKFVKTSGQAPQTVETPVETPKINPSAPAKAPAVTGVTPATPAKKPTIQAIAPENAPKQEVDLDESLNQFRAAEKALMGEYAKPTEQRNLGAILAMYKAIKVPEGTVLKPYVDYRISFLETAMGQKGSLEAAEKLSAEAAQRQKQYELERGKIVVATPQTHPVTAYPAQGVLSASEIFPGGAAAPKRYIVRDPQTLKITAYVQCTTGAVDLSNYEGQYVGIMGTTQYDPMLKLDVVEAQEVVVLKEGVELPTPPQPIVKPLPEPPAPKVESKPAAKPTSATPPPAEIKTTPVAAAEAPEAPAAAPAAAPVDQPEAPAADAPKPDFGGSSKPMPANGLPEVQPEAQPTSAPVNEGEYD